MKSFIVLLSLLFVLSVQIVSGQGNVPDTSGHKLEDTVIGFSKTVGLSYDAAVTKVKDELKKEGFGILTEVDVKATMKKKLDVDYRPYVILGACNPPLAHKALEAEPQIGLMLPCKLIVYVDKDENTIVAAIDPVKMMQGIENDDLAGIAATVRAKFIKVLNAL